jgi:hypothetical protein
VASIYNNGGIGDQIELLPVNQEKKKSKDEFFNSNFRSELFRALSPPVGRSNIGTLRIRNEWF